VTGVLRDAQQARELGYEVFLASTLDGPLGIAAALHAGAALQPDRACGLSTLDRFAPQPPPSLRVTAGRLAPPGGSGLGDGLQDWYTTLAASER
jgi:L-alanine-DL-glutamate epimerase-like enolase superfamily enzyme